MRSPVIESDKRVSICVLTFGAFPELAKQAIGSVLKHCHGQDYELIVGANAVCAETEDYLKCLHADGAVDTLLISELNLNQCPMMRKMLQEVRCEFVWWFDDDSLIKESSALQRRIDAADASGERTVMWGQLATCYHKTAFTHLEDPIGFVRAASWYRGLPPPSWKIGGKGEFDFEGKGTGCGKWEFIVGGEWFARISALRALDWPDQRLEKNGNDVFLGEAIRQQGWEIANIGMADVSINAAPRRGDVGIGFDDRVQKP